jgi:ATP-dependent exoDNAse (exonuclease V) alpha subunit
LATLTRHNATFPKPDLDRHPAKHISGLGGRAATNAAVLGHAETAPRYDRTSGEAAERFTTRTVRRQERAALAEAGRLARQRRAWVDMPAAHCAVTGQTLRPDEQAAFEHATAGTGLVLIEGRAGTGKSFILAAIRDAHSFDRQRVIGLAPTNAVAYDLKADGFTEAGTVHAELFRLKNGRTRWDRNIVVIVDEAAMPDTSHRRAADRGPETRGQADPRRRRPPAC